MINPTLKHVPCKVQPKRDSQRLTLTIVFHPDLQRIGQQCQPDTSAVAISRLSPLFGQGSNDPSPEPLADPFLSRTPISLCKKGKCWHLSNLDSPIPISNAEDDSIEQLHMTEQMLDKGVLFVLSGRIVLLCHYCPNLSLNVTDNMGLVGVSENITNVRNLVAKVGRLKAPVLIRGESGTGKEVVAQAIHEYSERSNKKLVCINMAAISKELVNTELFGSVKGGFTGAVSRHGCFKEADHSSLFLDEIGEASIEVQAALLRALETGVVQPVGSNRDTAVDVRFIAATDANLEALIGQESFRMPLLQRLSGLVIELTPLRNRREDIAPILHKLLQIKFSETHQLDKLQHMQQSEIGYWAWFFAQCCQLEWPGNVRQLKNMVTQLSIALLDSTDASSFDWHSFVQTIKKQHQIASSPTMAIDNSIEAPPLVRRKPREIDDEEVLNALEKHQWQIKLAASELLISRAALYQRIDSSPVLRRASNISSAELQSSFADCSGDLDQMVDMLQVSKQALIRRLHEIGLTH
ncbi:sigma-54-dependent Fis family transcriptional regulator [Thalassotalea euphylliae]|uniref:Sigma-54-dependent Fis family transcriptional regulator n=1 Tax=Thalassotalea euphylliae TaxID=1655234 RepID=A0A3E0TTF8_9GAMM|nr:sigma 54-interacting transcriptional regulator [Thalassotalea euphylliae]REL27205.1 sigma-54-dependent Fis family transcriptional regulator [Thalassotalea euphylliae]